MNIFTASLNSTDPFKGKWSVWRDERIFAYNLEEREAKLIAIFSEIAFKQGKEFVQSSIKEALGFLKDDD